MKLIILDIVQTVNGQAVKNGVETIGKISSDIEKYGMTTTNTSFAIWMAISLFTVFMAVFLMMFKQFIKTNNTENSKIIGDIAAIAPTLERVSAYLEKVSEKIDNDAKKEVNLQQSVVIIKSVLDSEKIDMIKSLYTALESDEILSDDGCKIEELIKSIIFIHRNKSVDYMNEFYINGRQLGTLLPPVDLEKELEMCTRYIKSRNKQKTQIFIEEFDRIHRNIYIMMKKRINDIFENLSENY